MIYFLKKLSKKYGVNIVREQWGNFHYNGFHIRYVVDYGGNNPQDFWLEDYHWNIKRLKKDMVNYCERMFL